MPLTARPTLRNVGSSSSLVSEDSQGDQPRDAAGAWGGASPPRSPSRLKPPPLPGAWCSLRAASVLTLLAALLALFSFAPLGSLGLRRLGGFCADVEARLRAPPGLRAPPPPPPPLPLRAAPPPAEEDPIVVVYVACSHPDPTDPEYFGLLSAKSLLLARAQTAAAARRYDLHVVTNVPAAEFFNTSKVNWDVQRLVARDPLLRLTVHSVADVDASVAAFDGALPRAAGVESTIFKSCAAARLKFPFFFASLARAIYMDWDSVALCDLTELWAAFDAPGWGADAVVGMALNDPTGVSSKDLYRGAPARRPAAGGLSSGVMLWRFDRLRARGGGALRRYWRAVVGVVEAGVNFSGPAFAPGAPDDAPFWALTKAFPLGDQDILNALFAPGAGGVPLAWLAPPLPPRFNWCLADAAPPAALDAAGWRRPLGPCVVHFCGARLSQPWVMAEEGDEHGTQHAAAVHLAEYFRSVVVLDGAPPPGLSE
jgi:hypothetical protein